MALFILTLTWRVFVSSNRCCYTRVYIQVGVLLLLHFYMSCIARTQVAKLGSLEIKSPSQQNYGGRSFLSYTLGHVLDEKARVYVLSSIAYVVPACRTCTRTSGHVLGEKHV